MSINRLIDSPCRPGSGGSGAAGRRRSGAQRDRIVREATRLFAERGFHAVSTREIARAVGLNVSTVSYHVGGKRDLYRAVVERLYEEEQAALGVPLQDVGDDVVRDRATLASVVDSVVDAVVDLLVSRPERPRLFLHRWLEPRDDLANAEDATYSLALFRPVRDLLERAQRAGTVRETVDLDYVLRSFTWILYGYFSSGPLDWTEWYGDPRREENIRRLRAFMKDFARRMLEA